MINTLANSLIWLFTISNTTSTNNNPTTVTNRNTTLLTNELAYWDKEYEELLKITPQGLHERTEYNNSIAFYNKRRALLIRKIK